MTHSASQATSDTMWRVSNRQEKYVSRIIDKLLEDSNDFCSCHRCMLDMKAIALNQVKPDYVPLDLQIPEDKTNLDSVQNKEFAHMFAQVYIAAVKVQKSPNHSNDESVVLRNSNHDILRTILPEFLASKPEIYRSSEHLSRIVAHALNEMKPRYITTAKGSAYARTDEVDRNHFAVIYSILHNALTLVQQEELQS